MPLSKREMYLLNLYRNSELHGALLMGRIARSVSSPEVLVGATRHCATEAQHAALLTEVITALGGTLDPTADTIQQRYSEDGGIPKDVADLLILSEVLEARVLTSYREHLERTDVHTKIRQTLDHIIRDEEAHSGNEGWAERWLATLPVDRLGAIREKWAEIDRRVADELKLEIAHNFSEEGAA
jgi:bacterioferritin (cytochrome b1)